MHILLADDDPQTTQLVVTTLKEAHFTVDAVSSSEAASLKLKTNTYDLAILDWCFAGEQKNGLTLLREICDSHRKIPVLMLTGRGALIDKVTGIQCGADDYLVKPFHLPELLVRVQALLRRGQISDQRARYLTAGPIVLDTQTYVVTVKKKRLDLNNKEFQLLRFLLERSGSVVTREQLIEQVWGDDRARIMSNTIDVHIKRLRDQLGSYRKSIRTVRGAGYYFETC